MVAGSSPGAKASVNLVEGIRTVDSSLVVIVDKVASHNLPKRTSSIPPT